MTPTPTLNALSIVVADMAAAIDFYARCGLTFADGGPDEPLAEAMHVESTLGSWKVMFDTRAVVESFTPGWAPPHGGHRMALAFECDSPASVDALHDDLVGAGYRSSIAPFDAVWGQRYAVILDPDDNPVDFYCTTA